MEFFEKIFLESVETRYKCKDLTISHMAEDLAMSDRSLQRRVKQVYKMSPTRYLLKYRLLRSTELLKRGTFIASVSFAVGFNSYHYYTRCFKREFGCTPKEYILSLQR